MSDIYFNVDDEDDIPAFVEERIAANEASETLGDSITELFHGLAENKFNIECDLEGMFPNIVALDRGYLYEEVLHKIVFFTVVILLELGKEVLSRHLFLGTPSHTNIRGKCPRKGAQ